MNIEARNDAIILMKLKSYLNFDPDHPTWAFIADNILRKNISPKFGAADPKTLISPFLQSWYPKLREGSTSVPLSLHKLLRIGTKYEICLDALEVDQNTKNILPIWYHIGIPIPQLWNSKWANCQKHKHNILTVGQMKEYIETPIPPNHTN